MPAREERTPEEVRSEIARERAQLSRSVEELRADVVPLLRRAGAAVGALLAVRAIRRLRRRGG
jgi:surfactin synthase thioesterase subunit